MGEVILDLRKGLLERRRLLDELKTLVSEQGDPQSIRTIGKEFRKLIDDIQPMRDEIRKFVAECD